MPSGAISHRQTHRSRLLYSLEFSLYISGSFEVTWSFGDSVKMGVDMPRLSTEFSTSGSSSPPSSVPSSCGTSQLQIPVSAYILSPWWEWLCAPSVCPDGTAFVAVHGTLLSVSLELGACRPLYRPAKQVLGSGELPGVEGHLTCTCEELSSNP